MFAHMTQSELSSTIPNNDFLLVIRDLVEGIDLNDSTRMNAVLNLLIRVFTLLPPVQIGKDSHGVISALYFEDISIEILKRTLSIVLLKHLCKLFTVR